MPVAVEIWLLSPPAFWVLFSGRSLRLLFVKSSDLSSVLTPKSAESDCLRVLEACHPQASRATFIACLSDPSFCLPLGVSLFFPCSCGFKGNLCIDNSLMFISRSSLSCIQHFPCIAHLLLSLASQHTWSSSQYHLLSSSSPVFYPWLSILSFTPDSKASKSGTF